MKQSEARILVFLKNVDKRFSYRTAIAERLSIDYGYLGTILKGMMFKKWIRQTIHDNKKYYHLRTRAPMTTAKKTLVKKQEK